MITNSDPDAEDLADLRICLRDRAEDLALALLGQPTRRGRDDWRWGNRGSISLVVRGPKRGLWFDFEKAEGGDLFALIQRVRCCSFAAALAFTRGFLGGHCRAQPTARARCERVAASRTRRYAEHLVATSSSIVGTIAERYLREHRGISDPLPTDLRFHQSVWSRETKSSHPALLMPAFDGDHVRRVHAVLLDRETGAKASLPAPKLTFGKDAAHVPGNLAARCDGPTLLVEGIEDAVTLWCAIGFRVLIAFGPTLVNIAAALPLEADLVVFGDNDVPGRRAAQRVADEFPSVRFAFAPDGIKDANALCCVRGPEAVRDAIRGARSLKPLPRGLPRYYPAPTERRDQALARQATLIGKVIAQGAMRGAILREVRRRRERDICPDLEPAEKARRTRAIKRAVPAERGLERVPEALRVLITGTQGSGKTARAVTSVAAISDDVIVWHVVPTLEKAAETFAEYFNIAELNSLPGMVVRGRGAPDPRHPGERMCPRHEVVNRAVRRGVHVRKRICESCPLQGCCGYLQQEAAARAQGERGVFFLARDFLFTPSSPAPRPDLLIIDESIAITVVDNVLEFDPRTLLRVQLYHGFELARAMEAGRVLRTLHDALMTDRPLAALRDSGVTQDDLARLRSTLDKATEEPGADLSGRMTDDEIGARLDAIPDDEIGHVLVLLRAVLREVGAGRNALNAIVYHPAKRVIVDRHEEKLPRLRVHRLKPMAAVRKSTTVLLLDGTGDPELNRRLFGAKLEHHRIAIERDAHVTGTSGRGYSRQSITGLDRYNRPIPSRTLSAKQLRDEIATIAARMPGPVLTVASKRAAEILRAEQPGFATNIAHFGAIRGLNTWERCASSLVVGRESVPLEVLEDLARAYVAPDPEPFVSINGHAPEDRTYPGWQCRATRMRHMRDGSLEPVEVEIHPHPIAQALLEQLREAEIVQAADRSRPIFNRRWITLMNDLCLDFTYDRILSHRDLVEGGDQIERAWALGNEVLPMTPDDLARVHPSLFRSAEAARSALQQWKLRGNYKREPFCSSPVFLYRRLGQRGPMAKILIGKRHVEIDAAKAAVESVLGRLTAFLPA